MRFWDRIREENGFTLIELLVVLSITGLLMGMMITYSSTGRSQIDLSTETAKISQLILRSKTEAVSTFKDPNHPCGYGMGFDYANRTYSFNSYTGFPDCNNMMTVQRTVIEEFSLPNNIDFSTGDNRLDDIVFIPPNPDIVLFSNGSILNGENGYVYLKTKDGTLTKIVKVNPAGQVGL